MFNVQCSMFNAQCSMFNEQNFQFCPLRSLHVLFPGMCKRGIGEGAKARARACFLRHYKGTTFAATVLTIAGDAVRFLYFSMVFPTALR